MNHQTHSIPATTDHSVAVKTQNLQTIQLFLDQQMNLLLDHPYFKTCQRGDISKPQMVQIMKNLYGFSVYFERILTRRISHYNSRMDHELLLIAKKHLREEIGHADMFRDSLLSNGVSATEIRDIEPTRYTKAIFGYLLATIEYENEYVTNIAVIQVLELIGYHFFTTTLEVMKKNGFSSSAFQAHSDDDTTHSLLGLEHCAAMDEVSLKDCKRVILDLFGLFHDMLSEWLQFNTNTNEGLS